MRKLFLFISLCVAITMQAQENKYAKYFKNLPFKMEAFGAPVIPNNTVNLKDFGAVGDGRTLCTDAFHKAMQALSKKGGGRLVVPEGVWLTGPLDLVSNLDLHLKSGAIILFSDDETLYPVIKTYYEGWEAYRTHSPIYGKNLVNVSITGHGVIDGNGQYWRPLKKEKVTEAQWKKFTAKGGVIKDNRLWYPSESYAYGEQHAREITSKANPTQEELSKIRRFVRPVMISLVGCKNVLLKGVIFQNSGAWNIHPLMCENVIIEDVLAKNPSYAQNGDALDLESCKNALIINSKFDAGDDGICIKSGKDADGRRRGVPCENVVVDGCTVFAGHGGFVVGSEMSGGVRNFKVSNCQFLGTDVGLRFKSTRGRGGIVENIFIDHISMMDIKTDAITFNMYYGGKSVAEMLADGDHPDNTTKVKVDETTPIFRNINIENVVCSHAGRAMEFNGLPEMPIDRINLKNITIHATKDAEFTNCINISKDNVLVIVK